MSSINLGVDTQKHNFALENNCSIIKSYFSDKNKELIKNKVKSLLESDDFMEKTLNITVPASVDLVREEGSGRTSQVQTEPANIVQLSSLKGQPPPIAINAFNKSEFDTLYDKKIQNRSYIQETICKDVCFDRLEDYMMWEYNAFVETQFVDPVKRKLVFSDDKNKIINYLDCRVIKTVLKESKLALQEHYYYMRDLNIKSRKMKEPINTREVKEALIEPYRPDIYPN
tara:strand:- start:12442 stop:13125 length:684 start_codon:yes stop_codon:yes gene_type:complete